MFFYNNKWCQIKHPNHILQHHIHQKGMKLTQTRSKESLRCPLSDIQLQSFLGMLNFMQWYCLTCHIKITPEGITKEKSSILLEWQHKCSVPEAKDTYYKSSHHLSLLGRSVTIQAELENMAWSLAYFRMATPWDLPQSPTEMQRSGIQYWKEVVSCCLCMVITSIPTYTATPLW